MSEPHEGHVRPGWSVPRPAIIPEPTAWPPALALGVAFTGWGIITSGVILLIGLAVTAISLWGWIGDIRHESR
jgi:hypothetical protein